MCALLNAHLLDATSSGRPALGLKEAIVEAGRQAALNLEARAKIYGSNKGVGL